MACWVELVFEQYKLQAEQGRFDEVAFHCREHAQHQGMVEAMSQVTKKYGIGTSLITNPVLYTSRSLPIENQWSSKVSLDKLYSF